MPRSSSGWGNHTLQDNSAGLLERAPVGVGLAPARVSGALIRRGIYNLDEFRDAQERLPVERYLGASYYERWFAAIRTLLVEKGVATAEELAGA